MIRNIILDFGGVIINLNYYATKMAFENLGAKNFDEVFNQWKQKPFFDLLDKGLLTDEEFYSAIKQELHLDATDAEIEFAWNAMLLDIPKHRLELLNQLRKNYNLFLLSNTNHIHLKSISKYLQSTYGFSDIAECFNKAYYSCDCKLRKPDYEFFNLVLNENQLEKTETLFVDDTIQHVEAAKSIGLQAALLEKNTELKSLLEQLKINC